MSYIPALDQIQLGQESAWGTSVAGSSKLGLVSDCTIEPEVEVEILPDIRGSMAPGFVSSLNKHTSAATIAGVATYDDLPYFLDSLFAVATPGTATTYTRAYAGQLGTVPTRRMYTLYKGSSGKVQKMTGAVVSEFTLKIESNKPWTYNAKFLGKEALDGTLASLSDRSQTPIHANTTTIYSDAVGGTVGATAITGIWFSLELNVKNGTGLVPKIGSLKSAAYTDGMAEATLKYKADVDAVTAAYLTAILGTSPQQQQIRVSSTTGAPQVARFDFGGVFTSAPKINTDQDGIATLEFEMNAIYNAALGNWILGSVTNSIASMV